MDYGKKDMKQLAGGVKDYAQKPTPRQGYLDGIDSLTPGVLPVDRWSDLLTWLKFEMMPPLQPRPPAQIDPMRAQHERVAPPNAMDRALQNEMVLRQLGLPQSQYMNRGVGMPWLGMTLEK